MKEVHKATSDKHKLGKERSKEKNFSDTLKQNESLATASEKNVEPKRIKKIKIRLADPSIPNSYICEVFDSSFEEDESDSKTGKVEQGRERLCNSRKDTSRPKDFFDVLMAPESRKNFTINTALQNEEISEETKKFREIESNDVLEKRKLVKSKNKEKLKDLVNKKKGINRYHGSSSDEESLFQVKSTLQFFTNNVTGKKSLSGINGKAKNKENAVIDGDADCDDNSKTDPMPLVVKKKNSNILNYFSKTTSCQKNGQTKPKQTEKLKVEPRKLTEINMFHTSTSWEDSQNDIVINEVIQRVNSNMKLAPLFQKRIKPLVDPEVQKARLKFLHNGLPTSMKKICNSQKNKESKYSDVLFPRVSHIQQKDDDELWNTMDISIPLLKPVEEMCEFKETLKTFRFPIKNEDIINNHELVNQKTQSNRNVLLRYKRLSIDSIFNGLREKKINFMKKMREDKKVNLVEMEDCEGYEGRQSLWTEVYRPKSDEIMGNKKSVARLSEWLKSWKEYDNEVKKFKRSGVKVIKLLDSPNNSDDEFVISDDDNFDLKPPVNICLLSGPIASGKTAVVYALARELDYNILEVNSSSRRTGKKLLMDLQEATKSHQVQSGLEVITADDNKMDKQIKKKLRKKKKRKEDVKAVNESNNNKISLILIEDADIFFENHDEGFVSAITTLVQSSKRPFVFLSNDPNHGYLERLKQQQVLVLEMRRPDFQDACAILDVIATIEGISLRRDNVENLIRHNKCDLRKSILELQFWIESGEGMVRNTEGEILELGKLWWGFNRFLFKKDSIHVLKLNYRKRKRSSELYSSSSEECEEGSKKTKLNAGIPKVSKCVSKEKKIDWSIRAYSKILDSVSVCDLFRLGNDTEPIPLDGPRLSDSLSLNECMETINWKEKDLSSHIIKELMAVSMNVFVKATKDSKRDSKFVLSGPSWDEIRWRNMQQEAKRDLSSLVPSNGKNSKHILHIDYLPVLRNICRTERNRFIANTKRKNRFSHYFRTLGCDLRDESLDISSDVFQF